MYSVSISNGFALRKTDITWLAGNPLFQFEHHPYMFKSTRGVSNQIIHSTSTFLFVEPACLVVKPCLFLGLTATLSWIEFGKEWIPPLSHHVGSLHSLVWELNHYVLTFQSQFQLVISYQFCSIDASSHHLSWFKLPFWNLKYPL